MDVKDFKMKTKKGMFEKLPIRFTPYFIRVWPDTPKAILTSSKIIFVIAIIFVV